MKSICFECSLIGKSCCKGTQICLTTGDVRRISQYLAVDSFSTIENPDLAYIDPGDDPGWLTLTLRSDGKRRVLKRTGNQSCMMLGENGCLLPMIVRKDKYPNSLPGQRASRPCPSGRLKVR